jgi:hypothetical protein
MTTIVHMVRLCTWILGPSGIVNDGGHGSKSRDQLVQECPTSIMYTNIDDGISLQTIFGTL